MKTLHLKILLLFLIIASQLAACTMEPSLWNTIASGDSEDMPGVFALSDALYQLREKLNGELAACRMPVLPLTFVGAYQGEAAAAVSSDTALILEEALQIIWQDARILPHEQLVRSPEDFAALHDAARAVGSSSYNATIHISEVRSGFVHQIDLNFWLYQLYRCVLREEVRVFLRVADSEGTAIFVDEITVSPTIIIDPMISPVGGYIIRFEKNTASPLMVDFGPLIEGGEHHLRLNDAYRQPSPIPPLSEFTQPASAGLGINAPDQN